MGAMVMHVRRVAAARPLAVLAGRLGRGWCRLMHSDITWPVNGWYECRKCRRRFPVPWETPPPARAQTRPAAGWARPMLVKAA